MTMPLQQLESAITCPWFTLVCPAHVPTCNNLYSSHLTAMQLEATVEGYHRTACGGLRVPPQWVHAAATAATRTHFAFDGSGVSAGMPRGVQSSCHAHGR